MKGYVIALDQGTTSSRAIVFNRSGEIVSLAQYDYPQIYPRPGWVEPRPGGHPRHTDTRALGRFCQERRRGRGHRRHRRHQPARDHPRLGPHNGQTRLQRHRLAVPPDRGLLRPAGRRGRRRIHKGQDGPAHRRLLFRHQDTLDTRKRAGRARASRARRAHLRHRGLLARLEPHRRAGAHLGLLQLGSRTMLFDIDRLRWDEDPVPSYRLLIMSTSLALKASTHLFTTSFGLSIYCYPPF